MDRSGIEIHEADHILRVGVIGPFRDKLWAEQFGQAIRIIREPGRIRSLTLDLSRCGWADPLPLLSCLLTLREAIARDIAAKTDLPGEKSQESLAFLGFLRDEGFLHQLRKIGVPASPLAPSESPLAEGSGSSILYSHCISMRVFDPPTVVDDPRALNKECLESLLAEADTFLEAQIPRWARADLRYRLGLVLEETLTNILMHAYPESENGRGAGVYARYRAGDLGIPQIDRERWRKRLLAEKDHCPRFYEQFLEGRIGCIEVFVLDAGIGMVESLRRSEIVLDGKYPFAGFFRKVLCEGLTSRPKDDRPTVAGGLQVLHDILESHGDIVRGLDDRTWAGVPAGQWGESKQHTLVTTEAPVPGLAWTLRLSWKEKTDKGREWRHWHATEGVPDEHPVLRVLRTDEPTTNDEFGARPVFDQRYDDPAQEKVGSMPPDTPWCLWLVAPGRLKNDILRGAGAILPRLPQARGWTLWIADIPVHEAGIYLAAFKGFNRTSRSNQWARNLDRVVLVTTHWSIVVLVHGEAPDPQDPHGFFPSSEKADELLGIHWREGIGALVRWLRWHDSRLLWDVIDKHPDDLTYIPEEVGWHRDESKQGLRLSGYLDFTQTLAIPRCQDLYRRALSRLPGLFEGQRLRLIPVDNLTSNLTETFNADELHPDPPPNAATRRQRIGSVMVTGTTSREAEAAPDPTIHFFVHPAQGYERSRGMVDAPRLFLWRPLRYHGKVDHGEQAYQRLGKSPLIAPGGPKYFNIPRFDAVGKQLAERTPEESYQDWQEGPDVLMRSGHWCYESHHDFLTLNLHLAVDRSFLTHGPLAAFLVREFFQGLNIKDDSVLSSKGRTWWKKVEAKIREDKGPDDEYPDDDNPGLIVYPSHPNTECVVDRVLGCFDSDSRGRDKPSCRDEIRTRIIRVLPLRRERGGAPMLISPLTLERIRHILSKLDTKRVTLFDDAAISGSTFRQIQAFLSTLGAAPRRAVFILNRLRLPADRRRHPRRRYFWRLDLPVLGSHRSCPLCRALENAAQLSDRLASGEAKRRIREWQTNWQAISPTSDWGAKRGFYAVKLTPPLSKQFGVRWDDNNETWVTESSVTLARSPALAAYNAEMRAMTGLDDQALIFNSRQAEKSKPLHWTVQIELFASQLLLFGHEHESGSLSRMLVELLKASFSAPDTDNATALAALTVLVLCDRRLAVDAIVDKAMELFGGQDYQLNLDIRIALAALIERQRIEGAKFGASQRLLQTAGLSLRKRYRLLYEETEGTLGVAHSTPLPRWLNSDSPESCPRRRLAALDSLDRLKDIIDGLDSSLARTLEPGAAYRESLGPLAAAATNGGLIIPSGTDSQEDRAHDPHTDEHRLYSAHKEAVLSAIRKSRDLLAGYSCDRTSEHGGKQRLEQSRTQIQTLLNHLAHFRNGFFFLAIEKGNLDGQTQGTVETALRQLFDEVDWQQICRQERIEPPIFKISINDKLPVGELQPVTCVLWDQPVVRLLKDLLSNARHARSAIGSPFEKDESAEAHLWGTVRYEAGAAVIRLANRVDEPAAKIWGELERRNLENWTHLLEMKGMIERLAEPAGLLQIQITLPYISRARSKSHSQPGGPDHVS